MPQRSTISLLPENVRREFDERLIRSGFSDYRGLAEWLGERGFEISKSAAQRYGSKIEERMAALKTATEQAKAIVAASDDDAGELGESLIMLAQEKVFTMLVDLEIDPSKVNISSLIRNVSELVRGGVTQKKFAAETRKRVLDELVDLEKGGMSFAEAVKRAREQAYG